MGEGAFVDVDVVEERRSRRSGEVMGRDFVEDAIAQVVQCGMYRPVHIPTARKLQDLCSTYCGNSERGR
jgi:hypothetical protein